MKAVNLIDLNEALFIAKMGKLFKIAAVVVESVGRVIFFHPKVALKRDAGICERWGSIRHGLAR